MGMQAAAVGIIEGKRNAYGRLGRIVKHLCWLRRYLIGNKLSTESENVKKTKVSVAKERRRLGRKTRKIEGFGSHIRKIPAFKFAIYMYIYLL